MLERLQEVERRYEELERLVVDPAVIANRREFAAIGRERSQLEEIVLRYRERKQLAADVDEHRELLEDSDPELRSIAKTELPALEERLTALDEVLRRLLLPKDPNDDATPCSRSARHRRRRGRASRGPLPHVLALRRAQAGRSRSCRRARPASAASRK
jgi:protein subunit release factor A